MNTTIEHGIYTNLRGTECACAAAKEPGKSFCRRCYFKLPKELRDALYQRDGYVGAFRKALSILRLAEPAGAEASIKAPPRDRVYRPTIGRFNPRRARF